MAVILTISSILKERNIALVYYECRFFTYDKDKQTLYAPRGIDDLKILLVLTKI